MSRERREKQTVKERGNVVQSAYYLENWTENLVLVTPILNFKQQLNAYVLQDQLFYQT